MVHFIYLSDTFFPKVLEKRIGKSTKGFPLELSDGGSPATASVSI